MTLTGFLIGLTGLIVGVVFAYYVAHSKTTDSK